MLLTSILGLHVISFSHGSLRESASGFASRSCGLMRFQGITKESPLMEEVPLTISQFGTLNKF
jgi:hypothetical protein